MFSEQEWAQQMGSVAFFIGLIIFGIGLLILKVAMIDGRVSDHFIGWGGVMGFGLYLCYKGITIG